MENAETPVNNIGSEINKPPETEHKSPLQTVIVAGMGPVDLAEIRSSDRLFPNSPYARRNAQAAKILASRGLSDTVIMSGFQSNPETSVTEAALQKDTYDRMQATFLPKELRQEASEKAQNAIVEEAQAETTFANITRSLNLLDKNNNGLYENPFSVLSSRFHTPRIAEMVKAFGLNAKVLSAEEIMEHYGYRNIDPEQIADSSGNKVPFQEKLDETYANQPGGLQNLQDNPSYVTFELGKIESDVRLQQMATALKRYYEEKGVKLPDCYEKIPQNFDTNFNYDELRASFREIQFSKHPYTGSMTGDEYKELARVHASETTMMLNETDPNPPTVRG